MTAHTKERRAWSAVDEALLRELYTAPGSTMGELAKRFGRTKNQTEAYVAGHRKPATPHASNAAAPTGRGQARAWWGADAEPVITANTKITVAPPLPERVLRTNTHSRI